MNDNKDKTKYDIAEIPQRHVEEIRRYEHKIGTDLGKSISLVAYEARTESVSSSPAGLDGDVHTI